MKSLLTSYTQRNNNIHLSIGKLYGILATCERCKRYKEGRCGKGKDGISVCRYGCSVYEEQDVVYFGLHLKGNYNSNKALKYDYPFVLTSQQFQTLQSYDKQLSSFDKIRQKALRFSVEYDQYVADLKAAFPDPKEEKWQKDVIVTTIDRKDFARFVKSLKLLIESRQQFSDSLLPPYFKDCLPSTTDGRINNSLIAPDPRCNRCRHCECSLENHGDNSKHEFQKCSKGVWYIVGLTKTYCGLHVVELEKDRPKELKNKYKHQVLFSKSQIISLINYIDERESEINIARRFLHDAGQYLSAIQNVLPYADEHEAHSTPFKTSSLISINAMVMALQCLKKQLSPNIYKSKTRRVFSPYQLFDKYRYCFADSFARISLIKGGGRDYYELISSRDGFDFAVLNLLSNAIKYLPPDKNHSTVKILFNHYGKGLEIVVESMGVKVDDSDLSKLGTRWFRGRNAIAAGVQGEGLGLHSVKTCMIRSGFGIKFASTGKVLTIKDVDYCNFSVRIWIPQHYIIDNSALKAETI